MACYSILRNVDGTKYLPTGLETLWWTMKWEELNILYKTVKEKDLEVALLMKVSEQRRISHGNQILGMFREIYNTRRSIPR